MSEIVTFTPLLGSGIPREAIPMKRKGTLIHINPETGEPQAFEIDLPVETYIRTLSWSMDFIRALRERPFWIRWFIPILFGRYAYREFIGLMDSIATDKFSPYYDYDIYGCEYHKDVVPWKWWVEREPLPMGGEVQDDVETSA